MNYLTSALPVLLNGISILAARGKPELGPGSQTGCLAGDEPGSRCLRGPPSQGIPPSPPTRHLRWDAAAPRGNPTPCHAKRGLGPLLLLLPDVGDVGDLGAPPAPGWCKAGRSLGTDLGGSGWPLPAEGTVACLSAGSPGACPVGQLGRGHLLFSSLPWPEQSKDPPVGKPPSLQEREDREGKLATSLSPNDVFLPLLFTETSRV